MTVLPGPRAPWHSPAAMALSFNTTGPCFPDEHDMLPPERRLGRVMELIEKGKYFTLHAGRQTGKTTSAQWLAAHYNAGDRHRTRLVEVGGKRVHVVGCRIQQGIVKKLADAPWRTSMGQAGVPAAR